MKIKSLALAIAAGIATFLLVGAIVTQITGQWIEFSLFLGIPAGIVTGAFTAAGVYFGLSEDAPAHRRRIAGTFATFGASFLVSLLALALIINMGMAISIIVSLILALLVAAIVYIRGLHTPIAGADIPKQDSV